MKPWNIYNELNTSITATFRNSEFIIEALGIHLQEFFNTKKRTPRTQLVKTILAELGHAPMKDKPPYKVYCNGLEKTICQSMGGVYKNAEWLYDLIWYTESADYLLITCPLVMECEWSNKRKEARRIPYSGIKYDFQKLVIANADLRLMIFLKKKTHNLEELDQYFEDSINLCQNLPVGSKFLFIAFDQSIKGFHYTEKIKIGY